MSVCTFLLFQARTPSRPVSPTRSGGASAPLAAYSQQVRARVIVCDVSNCEHDQGVRARVHVCDVNSCEHDQAEKELSQ